MKWPWIARSAYDVVLDERDRLRAQNDRLTDHLTRVQRREAGMTETPRAPRPALEPMPRELHDYIKGIAGGSLQKEIRDRCYRRHAKGEPWQSIVQEITQPEEP